MPISDERLHDRPARVDAGQLRGLRVAADGVHVASEPAPRREEGHDDGDAERDEDRDRDPRRDDEPSRRDRDPVLGGVLLGECRGPRIAVGDPDGARDARRCRRPRA